MKLLFDEDLVEGAVLDCARTTHPFQARRFHREREKVYSIADPDERNAAFFRLHLEWFREWGMEEFLRKHVAPFPQLPGNLKAVAFRKARSKSEEGSELYVNRDSERHAILALRPERFSSQHSLVPFLNHELMHINDMLDPRFGYSPDIGDPTQSPSQQRLIRERYRLLWDITIDGRLLGSNRETIGSHTQRRAEFNRAFSFLAETKREILFESLWNNPTPQHSELMALANDPRGLGAGHVPQPGGPCPLCGFPSFEWAAEQGLSSFAAAITRDFPHWSPDHGACKRCVEVYEANRSADNLSARVDFSQGADKLPALR